MQEFANRELLTSRALLTDFQDFIQQGNMIDMATGASPTITGSYGAQQLPLVAQVRLGRLGNKVPDNKMKAFVLLVKDGVVTINYGLFMENAVTFFINAIFLFLAVKKVFEVVFKRSVLVKKQCPHCKEFVKGDATRCRYCCSDMECPPSSRGFWMTPG
ncbi:large conductance mechanosensitive channel, putative [Phytophthora infestans T30-4]|uniref:Large conductance mechanosensitive channel, putative n=1 Tax=Phytophthora infestans (strain T30-4) TaxID=403677 RepID=D0P2C6_PHYIT|nr:large conductance mechanosensitive channel, putative [Phytophthora infestans T30-4]EEY55883.1 large conductance mechanosensitive channel, putative [Phytophthora infestans T30-4]|eukprot:XP_002895546.1 large conductance mechanosensitive channel, putative [Phytophthora infestans T30-4]